MKALTTILLINRCPLPCPWTPPPPSYIYLTLWVLYCLIFSQAFTSLRVFQFNSLLGWYQCYCNPMTATSDRGIRHTQRDHFIIILVLFTLQSCPVNQGNIEGEKRGTMNPDQNNCRRHSEFPTKFWAIIENHYNLGSQSFNLAFERIVFNL